MKFLPERGVGIFLLGVAAFILAIMQSRYDWDYVFESVLPKYPSITLGYFLTLILAAILLSLKEEK